MKQKFILIFGLMLFISACTKLPSNIGKPQSRALSYTENTMLSRHAKPLLQKHKGKSGFLLLGNNLDAFSSRIVLIDAAEMSIDAQYYAVEDQLTGKLFLKHLLDAADRGVRVRLLMDDLKTDGRDAMFAALDAHPNMSVRVFNPFSFRKFPDLNFITEFKRLDRRMHNKSFNVDNTIAILGGRNIGDKYFSASNTLEFKDLDVMIMDPKISDEVSKIFDAYWNDPYAYSFTKLHKHTSSDRSLEQVRQGLNAYSKKEKNSVYVKHVRKSKILKHLKQGDMKFDWSEGYVYSDLPQWARTSRKNSSYSMAPKILAWANKSKKDILIISPYFIPQHWGKKVFSAWRKQGIRVRVLTNSLASNDVAMVHAGYACYRKELLRMGVEIYELKPNHSIDEGGVKSKISGLHAKSFVFDGKNIFVGSMNLDPRSIVLNSEMGILIKSVALSQQLTQWIDKNLDTIAYRVALRKKDGFEYLEWIDKRSDGIVRYYTEPNVGFLKKVGIDILKVMPLEGEL